MDRNPYAAPVAHVSDIVNPDEATRADVKRGWPLTVFLVFISVSALFATTFYASLSAGALKAQLPVWMVRLFLAVSMLRIVSVMRSGAGSDSELSFTVH
jgi:hypothetical protein